MSKPVYLTAPPKTDRMPPGIPYIVGNEAAERFNFYGMRAILVVFMTKYLVDRSGALAPMGENDAAAAYHWFQSASYFFPTLGAIVSDAFWGKYYTIIRISLVYCLGSVVLAIDHTRLGLMLGLTLVAIGTGGIKACVSSHVGDQFGPQNQHLISRAFGWFYFSINAGSTFSFLLIPWLLDNYGPGPAFGFPALLMLIATFVFWLGRYKFAHIPPRGKVILSETFSREGLAALGKLAAIFVFMIIFWSLYDQSGGEWVLQGQKMNLDFLGIHWLAAQIQVVNGVMILAFIPLFQYIVYPAINRIFPLTPLRKIGLGLIVIGLSFLVSAWIERQISAGLKPSIGWQMPAYALLSAGEVMASITALEFAYTQAPKSMKSIVQALYLLSISGGNLLAGLVHRLIANPDGTVKLQGSSYYTFYSALSIGCVAVFVFVAKAYKEKTYVQGDEVIPRNEAVAET
jgi:proton-dependent oligopeptide transporter, POT family